MAIKLSGDIIPAGTFKIVDGSNIGGALTGSAVSSSGALYAGLTDAGGSYPSVVTFDTATGQFYYTGSYGGGGAGEGFPFTGDAVITGSLEIVGTTGALTASSVSASGFIYAQKFSVGNNVFVEYNGGKFLVGDAAAAIPLQLLGSSIIATVAITASGAISASGDIVGSNLSGTNTGDQDLSGYIQESQTSSMSVATASYVAGADVDGAVANATNADTASYILASNIDGTIDISDQTNLSDGTNTTVSGDAVNLDADITLTSVTASFQGDLEGTADQADTIKLITVSNNYEYHIPFVQAGVTYPQLRRDAGLGLKFNPGADSLILDGNFTASGAISASGNLYGGLSALSTTTVVTHQSSDGRLGTRTADARIFGSTLVDKTGSPTQYTVATFVNDSTIEGKGSFTFDGDDVTIGGKSGTITISTLGNITASGDISASGQIRAAQLGGQLSAGNITGTVDISSQTNLVGGTNLTLSGDTMNLDNNITLTGDATVINLIAGNNISGSGHLYASTSYAPAGDYNNVVLYDTATGKFYHTGSYGAGGGGGATPTGPDYAVQFNDGGSLGGDSGFTYDNSSYADIKISDPTAAALHLSSSAGISRIQLTSATGQVNYIRHQRGTGNTVYAGVNSSGNYFIDDSTGGATGIEFDVNGGTNSITAKTIDTTDGIFLNVTASALTASNILATGMSAGVDNSVVILDADGVLKTDEIDARVWGSSLVDKSGTPVDNQVAVFSDSNTIVGSTGLTWDAITATLEVGGKAGTALLSGSGDISGSGNLYIGRAYPNDLILSGDFSWTTIPNITSNNFVVWNSKTGTLGYQVGTSRRETKYDINPISQELANGISELQPVTYIYKADEEKRTVGGFIAEEVAEVNPLFAKWGPNYKVNDSGSLDVRNIIDDTIIPSDIDDRTILAAAVAKIQQLEQEIKELKAKIT